MTYYVGSDNIGTIIGVLVTAVSVSMCFCCVCLCICIGLCMRREEQPAIIAMVMPVRE